MNTQFGLPLTKASVQTLLPIICEPRCQLLGYFSIQETTFDAGDVPATFALAEGNVKIKSITLPPSVSTDGYGTNQYVAAVYTEDEAKFEPQGGYSSWIDINDTGNFAQWLNPAETRFLRYNRGVLINSILVNMKSYNEGAVPAPTPPDAQDGTQTWYANLNISISEFDCQFFDFNWIDTFKAKLTKSGMFNELDPLSISVLANPPGGGLKSTIVTGPGQQAFGTGAIIFSTIRVLKLKDITAGDYTFTYRITNVNNGKYTDVNLVLTVV